MRKEVQTNLKLVDLLNDWNPFGLEKGDYDTEIVDVIQAVYELDDSVKLAKRIQQIYEFSFEKVIPMEKCLKIAEALLVVKENNSCTL
ncbi:DUF1871 family protein [Neobacillus thermocopriae]|uniref:DUF1871 family protein n=1 Tax=Neobacillus thermocopriae TaxID=1215031 RepID=A0A6B3TQN6_9BACI|nr:DUF1871 family protein [Neobacillus thermocopriae]MED3624547.1 DUF1871 family protein [Neobacillus thermocopriae]MED3712940.1 DUF1871 family protein [Neobacillus thermocopriae]NEX79133.1 DUF1871 family protein [Neobacillus thermocopriae]